MNAHFQSIFIRAIPTTIRSNGEDSSQTVVANVGNVFNFLQPQMPLSINGPFSYAPFHFPHQISSHPISVVKPKDEAFPMLQVLREGYPTEAPDKSVLTNDLVHHRPLIDNSRLAAVSQKLKENIDRELRPLYKSPPILVPAAQHSEPQLRTCHSNAQICSSQPPGTHIMWTQAMANAPSHSPISSDETLNEPRISSECSLTTVTPNICVSPNQDSTPNHQKWKSSLIKKFKQEAHLPSTTPITNPPDVISNSQPTTIKSEALSFNHIHVEPPKKRRKLISENQLNSNTSPSGPALKSCLLFTVEKNGPLPLQPDFLQTNSLDSWMKLSDPNTNGGCLQYNSCNDFKIKSKCLSCRLRKHDEESKLFCRFVGFQIVSSDSKARKQPSFADWQMSDYCSQSLWLPLHPQHSRITYEHARYILSTIFPHFCKLVQDEYDILSKVVFAYEKPENPLPLPNFSKILNELDKSKRPLWRRAVESTRETCDVCETSVFNMSWSCISCGYIVCSECYDAKQICQPVKFTEKIKTPCSTATNNTESKEGGDTNKVPRQRRQKIMSGLQTWSYCTTNRMEHDLRLTQLIPGLLLWETSEWLHWVLKDKMTAGSICQCNLHTTPSSTPANLFNESSGNELGGLHILACVALSQAQSSQVMPKLEPSIEVTSPASDCTSSTEPILDPVSSAPHSFIACQNSMLKHKWKKSVGQSRQLLWLHDAFHKENMALFQDEWRQGRPVLISNCHERLDPELWKPKVLCAGKPKVTIIDCINNNEVECDSFAKFWEGFESIRKRPKDAFWKVKDWPSKGDFTEEKPELSANLFSSFPLPEYTHRDGPYNLISCLPKFFAQPDLGPKFYMAYGMANLLDIGTTNLHLDVADAVNVMIDIKVPKGISQKEMEAIEQAIEADPFLNKNDESVKRMSADNPPGALWHIFSTSDTAALRSFLLRRHPHYKAKRKIVQQMSEEAMLSHSTGEAGSDNSHESTFHSPPSKKAVNLGDPVHDQLLYLSAELLQQLYEEENVRAYSILQFKGDCIFIPAGCSHQVRNLHGCVKAAVDFVSPEHLGQCLTLTEEFRCLPRQNANQADKVQVKNIIYHAVKDCGAIVYSNSYESTQIS